MSRVGEFILRRLSRDVSRGDFLVEHYEQKHEDVNWSMRVLEETFPHFRHDISGLRVLDIGCAEGMESMAISTLGARGVIGIDIHIDTAHSGFPGPAAARDRNVAFCITSAEQTSFPDDAFDAVVSVSSFEHFGDPFAVLREAKRIVKGGGRIYLTSSVWAHPYGAHMHFFTKVPWVQFLFSEQTIMNVRRLYRNDGASRFSEVRGGLNKVGIRELQRYVDTLDLHADYLFLSPVKGLTRLTRIPLLNELFTNQMIAVLRKREPAGTRMLQ